MGKPIAGQKKVTTVWLEPESGKTKLFKCFNCGLPLAEYTGDAIAIVPGAHPYIPSTTHKCRGMLKPMDTGTHVEQCVACNGRGYHYKSENPFEECGMYYTFAGTVMTRNPELT